MMQPNELAIEVEGSSGDIYQVKLYKTATGLKTSCSCQAGQKNIHCKHRLALFAGDFSHVRGNHPGNLDQLVVAMLQGSQLQTTLNTLAVAEQNALRATTELKRVKKSLDRVMHE